MKKKPIIETLVFHLLRKKGREILPEKENAGKELPQTLVIPPGLYRFYGHAYALKKEGLYRFMFPSREDQQRIVYRKDIEALVSALCWINTHGVRDDQKSFDQLLQEALTGKLILTCGPLHNFACQFMKRLGIRCRIVSPKTLEKLNNYNDGHVQMEIDLDGRWILFDLSQRALFRFRGKRLSMLELVYHVRQKNAYQKEILAQSVPIAIPNVQNGYDYGFWAETVSSNPEMAIKILHRVLMIPVIPDSEAGVIYFTAWSEAERKRARENFPGMRYLSSVKFCRRFYPGEKITLPGSFPENRY